MKYHVSWVIAYDLEADDKESAIAKGKKLFLNDLENELIQVSDEPDLEEDGEI
jgi:hypothetical protein